MGMENNRHCVVFSLLVALLSIFLVVKRRDRSSYFAFVTIILGLIFALLYTETIFKNYFPWLSDSYQIKVNKKKGVPKPIKPLPKP